MAICVNCGKEFEPMHGRMKFCGKTCRHSMQWRQRQAEAQKTANIKPQKYARKARPVLITDAEQRKLDQELFLKTAVHLESKVYKPGDPEFEAIAKTVTPLGKIPEMRFHYHRYERNY